MKFLPKKRYRGRDNRDRCKVWRFGSDGRLEYGMSDISLLNLKLGPKALRVRKASYHQDIAEYIRDPEQRDKTKRQIADELGVSITTLYRVMKAYPLDPLME